MDMPIPAEAVATRPPFVVWAPSRQDVPVVFVSAHSGADYSEGFLARSRLDRLGLRRSEDGFVDELFDAAPRYGAPLLTARFPRAFCDANREKWELDPGMFTEKLPEWVNTGSPRVQAGLGTIARVVASGEAIYRGKLEFAEARSRIEACWQPFHDALEGLVAATIGTFGACLVVDCHSMPAIGAGRPPADIVLGDAHGTACAGGVVRAVERAFADLGFAVRRNDPYAGGFITRHYGRPREHTHAIQIEVARALYMDEVRVERGAEFARIRAATGRFVERLSGEIKKVLPRP